MLDFSYTKAEGISPIPIVRLYFANPKNSLLLDSSDFVIIDAGSDITVVSYSIISKLQLKPLQLKKDFVFRGLGQLNTGIPYLIKISFDNKNFIDAKIMGACDFLQRKFTSLDFLLVLLALISLSDFYFQKVTRTQNNCYP